MCVHVCQQYKCIVVGIDGYDLHGNEGKLDTSGVDLSGTLFLLDTGTLGHIMGHWDRPATQNQKVYGEGFHRINYSTHLTYILIFDVQRDHKSRTPLYLNFEKFILISSKIKEFQQSQNSVKACQVKIVHFHFLVMPLI